MDQPLTGIRVIEIATMIAVPQATQLLASYGAEVIKVEDTDIGDQLRFFGSSKNGLSAWFLNANSGKRSIALDLKTPEGKDVLKKLAADADVLVEGFRGEAVMERLGLGYATLCEINSRLIYCSSSGYGSQGPYADRPAYDPLIQSLSGWAGAQVVDGQPTLIHAMAADKVGAYNNTQAIMAALIKRSRTGKGCHVRTNMLDANTAFVWPDVMMHCALGDESGIDEKANVLDSYRLQKTANGWAGVAIGTDKQWAAACDALDGADNVERFKTVSQRSSDTAGYFDCIDSMTSKFETEEVVRRLVGADVPCAPVLRPEEVFFDPHIRATETLQETVHPSAGLYRHPRPRASQFAPAPALAPAPHWGEHTVEILSELGFSDVEIETLSKTAVIRA